MEKITPSQLAGNTLRRLIQENYNSQEEFANDYGLEIRTVSRYLNSGINKVDTIQELAAFFNVAFVEFFSP